MVAFEQLLANNGGILVVSWTCFLWLYGLATENSISSFCLLKVVHANFNTSRAKKRSYYFLDYKFKWWAVFICFHHQENIIGQWINRHKVFLSDVRFYLITFKSSMIEVYPFIYKGRAKEPRSFVAVPLAAIWGAKNDQQNTALVLWAPTEITPNARRRCKNALGWR